MRLGFFLPQIGPAATAANIVRVAQRADELGFGTVWVTERLLFPIDPQTPYTGVPGTPLPAVYKRVFDPLATLTFVAAKTSRVGIGTSVLDMPFYHPLMLGRRLTAIDVLSGGRLRVGFGQGWSKDEHDAMNASMKGRGRRADEFLQALKAIWGPDPVEFHGTFFNIPKSIIELKPAQKPHPPIYLAAFSPSALRRVAKHANGWHPVGLPNIDVVRNMLEQIRSMAKEAGRKPDEIDVIFRANFTLTEKPMGADRMLGSGSPDQIKGDIAAVKALGASEMCFDPTFSPDGETVDGFLRTMERIRKLGD
jgi:probable F420-dependent oxidoreductase